MALTSRSAFPNTHKFKEKRERRVFRKHGTRIPRILRVLLGEVSPCGRGEGLTHDARNARSALASAIRTRSCFSNLRQLGHLVWPNVNRKRVGPGWYDGGAGWYDGYRAPSFREARERAADFNTDRLPSLSHLYCFFSRKQDPQCGPCDNCAPHMRQLRSARTTSWTGGGGWAGGGDQCDKHNGKQHEILLSGMLLSSYNYAMNDIGSPSGRITGGLEHEMGVTDVHLINAMEL